MVLEQFVSSHLIGGLHVNILVPKLVGLGILQPEQHLILFIILIYFDVL